jgi:membrane protein required for colicin V production
MTPADYVIVLLVLASAAVGVWRGFTTEALSLVTLLAGIWLAWAFAGRLDPYLGEWDSSKEVELWAARLIIFVAVLIVGGLVSWAARKFVQHTGLSGVDRTLGALFGLLRAAVFVGLGVLVLQFAELEQESWWREARFRPYAEQAAAAVRYYAELGTRYFQEQPVGQAAGLGARVVTSSV